LPFKDLLTPSRKAWPCILFNDKEPCLSLRLCVSRLFILRWAVPVPENAVARHGESSTCGSPPNAPSKLGG
jgi:hypothetical protein